MKRFDEFAVFAAVIGFVVLALAICSVLMVKSLAYRECMTLGYQDSITGVGLPIKRVCIYRGATEDKYVPLAVARAFAR